MPSADDPRTGPRHEHERHYERAPDPAESSDRPLEPKSPPHELSDTDQPGPTTDPDAQDPHHALNTPVGEPDPAADSDPYRQPTAEDEQDRASGTRGEGQGSDQ
jgi:hypothetical protein